jgi:hypothetical protein
MVKIPRIIKFCTRVLHMEGEDGFGFQKRQPDMPHGDKKESHKPNWVNFTRPRVETRSSQAQIASCSLTNIQQECFSNPQ